MIRMQIVRIIVQATVDVAEIVIEKWITKRRRERRRR